MKGNRIPSQSPFICATVTSPLLLQCPMTFFWYLGLSTFLFYHAHLPWCISYLEGKKTSATLRRNLFLKCDNRVSKGGREDSLTSWHQSKWDLLKARLMNIHKSFDVAQPAHEACHESSVTGLRENFLQSLVIWLCWDVSSYKSLTFINFLESGKASGGFCKQVIEKQNALSLGSDFFLNRMGHLLSCETEMSEWPLSCRKVEDSGKQNLKKRAPGGTRAISH